MDLLLVIIAQTAPELPVPSWLGETVLGTILLLVIGGIFWARPGVNVILRELAASQAREAAGLAREAQNQRDWREQVLPALHAASTGLSKALEATVAVQKAEPILTELRSTLAETKPLLVRLEVVLDRVDRDRR